MSGGAWVRSAPPDELAEALRPLLVRAYGAWERSVGTAHSADAWFRLLVTALQAEATTLENAVALARFALVDGAEACGPDARAALQAEPAERVLRLFADSVSPDVLTTPEAANAWLGALRQHFRDGEGLRGRAVMYPLRAALTGSMVGPCLGNVTSLLGADRCRERARAALAWMLRGPH